MAIIPIYKEKLEKKVMITHTKRKPNIIRVTFRKCFLNCRKINLSTEFWLFFPSGKCVACSFSVDYTLLTPIY